MESVHGNLLLGGMSLDDIDAVLESDMGEDLTASAHWCGHAAVDTSVAHCLETGRRYRLELDDGRTGMLVIREMHLGDSCNDLVLEFEGRSPLK